MPGVSFYPSGMPRQQLTLRWRIIARIVIVLVRTMRWRVDVRGLEHVPTDRGAVLAFNHHSYFDFVMVAWAIVRGRRRPVRFLAKREIWQSRKVGWVVRWAEAVPVDRESSQSRHGAYDAAVASLRNGDLVAVAPEQTISPSYELLPFRTGAVRMAQQAGAPIIPAVGWGTHRSLPKGHRPRLLLRLPVIVEYGEPFHVGPDEDPVEATARLQDHMARILERVQRSYPVAATPGDDWWLPSRLGGSAPDHASVLAEHRRRAGRWREEREREERERRDGTSG